MAKKYPGGVLVATAFKMNDPQPIVDYMVVELLDDLDTLPNQFNGMLVFVEEDQQNWLKKAIGWVPASQQINTSIFRTKLEQKVLSYTFESTVNSLLLTQETGYYFDSYGLIQTINFLLKIEDDFFLYDGREHTFINMQATAIRFKHLFATENPLALKFFFPDEEDFILLPKQSIKIKWIAYLNAFVLIGYTNKYDEKKFNLTVSQTTNIIMIGYKERVSVTALESVTNVESFSEFVVWKGDIPMTTRTNVAEINTDILSLTNVEVSAGYTIQFRINIIPGQSNASAILKSVKI